MARITFDTEEKAPIVGRVPFDAALWQARDAGDFINTKTGEIREGDDFLSEADADNSDGFTDLNEASQDATGDDFIGAQVRTSAYEGKNTRR